MYASEMEEIKQFVYLSEMEDIEQFIYLSEMEDIIQLSYRKVLMQHELVFLNSISVL